MENRVERKPRGLKVEERLSTTADERNDDEGDRSCTTTTEEACSLGASVCA